MGTKAMQRPILQVPGQHPSAGAVLVHQQIERNIFDEEVCSVLETLLIERVQNGMTGSVGRCTSALRQLFSILEGLAPERALIDLAILGTREWNAVMLQFQDGWRRFAAHIFDGVLITEPVGAFHRVVHVKVPIIAVSHVAK
jgi:hypothetical protein